MAPPKNQQQEKKARCGGETWRDNWQQITGDEYSIRSVLHRVHPDDTPGLWRAIFHAVRTGGRFNHRYRLRSKSGSYVAVEGSARWVIDDWYGVIQVIGDVATPTFCSYFVVSKRERK
jgi:hypothetical protein